MSVKYHGTVLRIEFYGAQLRDTAPFKIKLFFYDKTDQIFISRPYGNCYI